jgi:hypothetical protein
MGVRDSGLLLPVDKLATKAILEKKVEKEFLGFGGGVGRYRCRSIVGSSGENLRGVKARHVETGWWEEERKNASCHAVTFRVTVTLLTAARRK